MSGAVEPVDWTLSATEARTLTDKIRTTLQFGHKLIVDAWKGSAWSALGYESWDAYCAGEFNEARMIRMDREQRREIVAEMRQAGMSTPAIASGIGVSKSTVHNDLPVLEERGVDLPDQITRTDGRGHSARWASRPASQSPGVDTTTGEIRDEPTVTQARSAPRRALTDQFFDAAYDLTKAVERVERLAADDRWSQNADKVAAKHRNDLIRTRDALQGVINRLPSA